MLTVEQYIAALQQLPAKTQEMMAESIVVPSGNLMLGLIKNRILLKGEKTDGGDIGHYGTKAAYYSRKQFVKQGAFKGTGKPMEGKKKGKKGNKTMYLKDGYYQLRDIQGMPNDKVRVNYTGETMLSFQLTSDGSQVLIGFTTERSSNIRGWMEKKYGTIYSPSVSETERYREQIITRIKTITQRLTDAL